MITLDRESSVGVLLAANRLPALEARALLAHQLSVPREHLVARPEQAVTPVDAARFSALVERRLQGEPLAYLLGEKEFYGRTFAVSPAVLIPRPETELLVDIALRLGTHRRMRVLDLGTGSGCIAITLALRRPQWQVCATDLSDDAIEVATRNASRYGASTVSFAKGSWFAPLASDSQFDMIVSNPPYVAGDDPHLAALGFEPPAALVAGENGLACLRTIIEGAPQRLSADGWLILEHSHDQGSAVRALFDQGTWRNLRTEADLAGIERVTCAMTAV